MPLYPNYLVRKGIFLARPSYFFFFLSLIFPGSQKCFLSSSLDAHTQCPKFSSLRVKECKVSPWMHTVSKIFCATRCKIIETLKFLKKIRNLKISGAKFLTKSFLSIKLGCTEANRASYTKTTL